MTAHAPTDPAPETTAPLARVALVLAAGAYGYVGGLLLTQRFTPG